MQVTKSHFYKGHKGAVYALLKADRGNSFFSGGSDRYLVQWQQSTQEAVALAELPGIIYTIKSFADNALLVGDATGGLYILDLRSKQALRYLKLEQGSVFDVVYIPQHNYIAVATGAGVLLVLDSGSFQLVHSIKLCALKLRKLLVNSEAGELSVACGDGSIRTFTLPDFRLKAEFKAHQGSVYSLVYTGNATELCSGGNDAHIKVWNSADCREVKSIAAHNYSVYDLQLNPSGTVLASSSRDKNVKLWDAGLEKVLVRIDKEKYDGHAYSVNKLCWLNDQTLLSTGDDGLIMEWNIKNNEL